MHLSLYQRIVLCLLVCGLLLAPLAGRAEPQPVLQSLSARLPILRAQIEAVSAAAQTAVNVKLAYPAAPINFPGRDQEPFNLEFLSRAGGYAVVGAYDTLLNGNEKITAGVLVLGVRSWEKQRRAIAQRVKSSKAQGWTVIVIGSAAGCPDDLGADAFLDNGAPSPGAEHGRVNIIANVILGWMWCCEYGAAFSRHGVFPVVLYSAAMPGAKEYNAKYRAADTRNTLLPCDQAIPAGQLAECYLKRAEQLVADCASERIQGQIIAAAEIISTRMRDGKTVGLSGIGHLLGDEMRTEMRAPWKPFLSRKTPFNQILHPGDLLVWMAYAGMNSAYSDFTQRIADTGADLITCYAPAPHETAPKTVAHIDQCWTLPDTEVPIPIFPNRMAPISGLNSALVLRMLDDEVAKRLK